MDDERRYGVIIYWSAEDDAFVAEFPEVPGCESDGQTYEEALANVQIIIGEWIETTMESGREIPVPRWATNVRLIKGP